jgi:hypothetical protein
MPGDGFVGCGDIYLLFSDNDYLWVAALFALLVNLAWSQSSIGLNELMNHRCERLRGVFLAEVANTG